ncbi:alpha/beta hydrolase [Hymenobacter tibetensis]|uniref:Alpha/beta hydrolase n=1 Tax=Hymenobacter tibetensis TaxID=497967 RepID=A0ABY4CZ81_9BACT|nr:alpha/beta fold hydrolase [Hymenobacter tibetensis]UOG75057.1 alpha/beta hydrolase [Hymenobacter tibetensis]
MKLLVMLLAVGGALYFGVCVLVYFQQERLLFFPQKLAANYRFSFGTPFQERWFKTADGTRLHALLFTVPASKGLVFYLHGNAGALDSWGEEASTYTRLGYEVLLLDYRGYGKSGGQIESQAQFLQDVETVYQHLLTEYPENRVVLVGYSLGTGAAAWLAARHQPRLLLLQAPYPSLRALARQYYPWVPAFLVRYPMATYKLLPQVTSPIVIFHGDQDEVIAYQLAASLKAALKPQDHFITLPGVGHNTITNSLAYQEAIGHFLGQ